MSNPGPLLPSVLSTSYLLKCHSALFFMTAALQLLLASMFLVFLQVTCISDIGWEGGIVLKNHILPMPLLCMIRAQHIKLKTKPPYYQFPHHYMKYWWHCRVRDCGIRSWAADVNFITIWSDRRAGTWTSNFNASSNELHWTKFSVNRSPQRSLAFTVERASCVWGNSSVHPAMLYTSNLTLFE